MSPDKSPAQCNNCKHAIVNNEDQTGCNLNLLDSLKPYKEDGDKFYKLNKICLYKNKDKSEVDIKLGYIFILNNESLINTLKENIKKVANNNPAWIGVVLHTTDYNKDIKDEIDKIGCRYNIVSNFKEVDDIYKLDQFIDLFHNGWTLINIVGEDLYDIKDKLENFVLTGNRAAIIKDLKDPDIVQINGIVYYNYLYKMLNGNLPELIEDEKMYLTKSFAQKVFEKNPEMIVSWEDL